MDEFNKICIKKIRRLNLMSNKNGVKILNFAFLSPKVCTRPDVFVHFTQSQGPTDVKNQSPFVKLGMIPGTSLKGFLRNLITRFLVRNGVSVCHSMPSNTMTSSANKENYDKDLAMGFHGRGACKDAGQCVVYQLFGDLGQPANLTITSLLFHPASNGGTIGTNLAKVYSYGRGRVELWRNSPRAVHDGTTPYMGLETNVASNVEAPFTIRLRKYVEEQYIVLVKALEFLFEMMTTEDEDNYEFLLGGLRNFGCGVAFIVKLNKNGKYTPTKAGNVLGFDKDDWDFVQAKWDELLPKLQEKFPIEKWKGKK